LGEVDKESGSLWF